MIPLRLLGLGAAAAVVVAIYHFTPFVGPAARLERLAHDRDRWRVAADNWKTASEGWERSYGKSEGFRVAERQTSRAAVDDLQLQCDARVRQARASAKVIREIAYAPVKLDGGGCPVRGVVGADRLRDALQANPAR